MTQVGAHFVVVHQRVKEMREKLNLVRAMSDRASVAPSYQASVRERRRRVGTRPIIAQCRTAYASFYGPMPNSAAYIEQCLLEGGHYDPADHPHYLKVRMAEQDEREQRRKERDHDYY